MSLDTILAKDMNCEDAYDEASKMTKFVNNNEERSITSLGLEGAVEALKELLKVPPNPISFPDYKKTQQQTILYQMALWVEVSQLRKLIQDNTIGNFKWKDVDEDIRGLPVSEYLRRRKNSWTSASKRLEELKGRDENEANSWNLKEELCNYLKYYERQVPMSDAEIEAGVEMVMQFAHKKGNIHACDAELEDDKITASQIIPIERLDELPLEDISRMLAEELNHNWNAIAAPSKRTFEDEKMYLEVIFTQFAWVSTLKKIFIEKGSKEIPKVTFKKKGIDSSNYCKAKAMAYSRCLERMEVNLVNLVKTEKGEDVPETVKTEIAEKLKSVKTEIEEKLESESSLHLSKANIAEVKEELKSRIQKLLNSKSFQNKNLKRPAAQISA